MALDSNKTKHHWIYPLGGADLVERARKWQERKSHQGKSYAVIEAAREGPAGRLSQVGNSDVLYVYADAVREGRLGEWQLDPSHLAANLLAEDLDPSHRSLKIFASFSGDASDSQSYAEQLFETMRPSFPHLTVFGFRGRVDAEGFDGHKTAGLSEDESLDGLTREEWFEKGARARDNRVQFPPGDSSEEA